MCRWIANCLNGPYIEVSAHDNLFEYLYESFDPATHGDVDFMYGNHAASGTSVSFYNNIIRHTNIGQTVALTAPDGGSVYVFNNIRFDNKNDPNVSSFLQRHDHKCDSSSLHKIPSSGVQLTSPIANPQKATGTANFQNNHFIGFPSQALSAVYISSGNCGINVIDKGSEIYQSESSANGQGYTPGNNYQPTSSAGATIGAGSISSSCPSLAMIQILQWQYRWGDHRCDRRDVADALYLFTNTTWQFVECGCISAIGNSSCVAA